MGSFPRSLVRIGTPGCGSSQRSNPRTLPDRWGAGIGITPKGWPVPRYIDTRGDERTKSGKITQAG